MHSANQQLAQRSPSEPAVSISDLQESDSPLPDHLSDEDADQHVQMDIACGVLDLKDEAALSAAEAMLHSADYAVSIGNDSDSDVGSANDSERDSASDGDGDDDPDTKAKLIGMGVAAHDTDAKHNTAAEPSGGQGLQTEAAGVTRAQSKCTSNQAQQNSSKILEL